MSYSTYWSYLYSVALLNLCLVGECALAPGRPDPLKGVYGQEHLPNPVLEVVAHESYKCQYIGSLGRFLCIFASAPKNSHAVKTFAL